MPFTIASFNARDLVPPAPAPAGAGGPSAEELEAAHQARLRSVARTLTRLDADVVCLQEVNSEDIVRKVLGLLPPDCASYREVIVGRCLDKRGLRLAILSRFELDGPVRHHDASEEPRGFGLPAPEAGLPVTGPFHFRRGMLEATVRVPGIGPLTVMSVHLKSNYPVHLSPPRTQGDHGEGLIRAAMVRMAEALRIRRIADERLVANPDALLAVGGDFNEVDTALVHRIISGDRPEEIRLSLAGGTLYPCSAAVPSGQRYSNLYRGRRELLDHILVSEALHARFAEATILNDALYEPEEALGTRAVLCPDSDHAPVLARFRCE